MRLHLTTLLSAINPERVTQKNQECSKNNALHGKSAQSSAIYLILGSSLHF